MKTTKRHLVLPLVFALAQVLSACAPAAPETQVPATTGAPPARVTLPSTEVRQLHSTATGRDYDIYVRLPDAYAQEQDKSYPVLYSLDGQWDFKMLDSIYGGLHYDGFVPELIIVGITYSGEDADYGTLRATDYTPVSDPRFGGFGEAPKFLAFIKDQLIPFIEANYRADASQKMLMGSSFGGTFALYALFSDPALFNGYLAASPVVPYGNNFAFEQEAEYARSHGALPVRLFICVGEVEELRWSVERFMQVLRERNYTGLELETRTIAGEGHSSNKPEAYNRGIRFLFEGQ
jgi:predicted alpha/beta superfamily hydrolase